MSLGFTGFIIYTINGTTDNGEAEYKESKNKNRRIRGHNNNVS
ncbi:hypothetical protein [Chryseosolibacter indicus]|nr:hypothetical protein [Chryseosolibacter indicus]